MKTTLIGKAKQIEQIPSAVKVIVEFVYEKSPAFPKGVPPIPTTPFIITCFIGGKQWKKVEATVNDPEDKLIIEGQAAMDPQLGLVIHATNINSLKLQRAAREQQQQPVESTPSEQNQN